MADLLLAFYSFFVILTPGGTFGKGLFTEGPSGRQDDKNNTTNK